MKLNTEMSDVKTLDHGGSKPSTRSQMKRIRRASEIKTAQPPARPVLVAKVISKDVPLYLDEIGTCAAYETVQIQAQVSGQIIARHFQDGADVKKGDLLFTIDPRPYQAALEQAQAQATLDQITMKRQQELRARNVISPQDLDTAQANAHKSEAATAAAQVNLDFCYIKSPINGRAGLRLVDVGNIVTGNTGSGAVLLTIQGLDPIYTDFTVAETDLALVRKYLGGPNVKVQTYSPDDKIPPRLGDLYFIDTAVLSQSGPFIFVMKSDNTVDLRPVKPGQRQDGDLMVVESGVEPGETVVVTGQLTLAPGSKVDPKPYGAANPPGGQSAAAKSSL